MTITQNLVRFFIFRERGSDPADEDATGCLEGFWIGEIDTWGKYTIRSVDGGPTVYLFADEIVDVSE